MSMRRRVNEALIGLTGYQLTRAKSDNPSADDVAASGVREDSPWQLMYGCVDKVSRREATGWLVGPAEKFPVQVALYLDELKVRVAWTDQPNSANTMGEAYSFRIPLRDIWDYCSPSTRISVRLDGKPLPIAGKGIFKRTATAGQHTIDDLQQMFAAGYLFNDYGILQLSKKLDLAWQARVIDLYRRVGDVLRDKHGYDAFVVYGSLLGQVREQGFIAHDDDFDAAYVSRETSGSVAATELRDIGLSLVDAGFDVDPRRTALHIHDSDDPDLRVDLFHLFFDGTGRLQMPFGRAGTTELTQEAWQGTEPAKLGEHTVMVPRNAELWVEHIYGDGWKRPQPGFNWERARTAQGTEGFVLEQVRQDVYWSNFYAHHSYTSGSTFFEFVNAYPGLPTTVLDFGCGDGRDSFAFASAGRAVVGVDRSHVGIEHATKRAAELGLINASFKVKNVGDAESIREVIARTREAAGGGPLLYYLRFFLHSLPEDIQDCLLTELGSVATAGDALAAEFRTDKDAELHKVHGRHYRRYQSAAEFAQALQTTYRFTIDFEVEGTGLAPYKDEDPVVYRVVAFKR